MDRNYGMMPRLKLMAAALLATGGVFVALGGAEKATVPASADEVTELRRHVTDLGRQLKLMEKRLDEVEREQKRSRVAGPPAFPLPVTPSNVWMAPSAQPNQPGPFREREINGWKFPLVPLAGEK
jgi:hypothetical protein